MSVCVKQVTCEDTHTCSTRLTLFLLSTDIFVRHYASAISFPRVSVSQQAVRVSCDLCVVENVAFAANCEISQHREKAIGLN